MAAHAVTGLAETIGKVLNWQSHDAEMVWSNLRAALDISCWTEDLPPEYWSQIHVAVEERDVIALFRAASEATLWALPEWYNLGVPCTREEWHDSRAKRGDFDDLD
jgi:hypothetical protein